MDPNEITKLCDRLKLDLQHTPSIFISATESNSAIETTTLVGKIISTKAVNQRGLENVLRLIWRTKLPFRIEAKGGNNNIFLFHFRSEEDRDFIYDGSPWHFNKRLISLVKPCGAGDLNSMDFSIVPFWVRLLNLPMICVTEKCVESLGGLIGEVMDVDLNGCSPRVRVKMDVSKPLKRGLRVFVEALGEEYVVPVQFENLHDFCFDCGLIGHCSCDCVCPTRLGGESSECSPKYGDWLRVVNNGAKKKTSRQTSSEQSSEVSVGEIEPHC